MTTRSDLIKVVSWNIMHGLDIDRAIEALATRPQLAQADVLLLQEMDEEGTAAIAEALDLHYAYGVAAPHTKTGRDFGNAVLSPAPLRDRTVVELPHQAMVGGHPRVAVSVVADVAGAEVTLCTTHTEIPALSATKRQEQFATVAGAAARWPTRRAIVGGDFNTVTQRGVHTLSRTLAEADLVHVSIEAITTLRRVGQDFTLDHIFARRLWPVESGVVRDLDVSDHAPIWVVLEPERPACEGGGSPRSGTRPPPPSRPVDG